MSFISIGPINFKRFTQFYTVLHTTILLLFTEREKGAYISHELVHLPIFDFHITAKVPIDLDG